MKVMDCPYSTIAARGRGYRQSTPANHATLPRGHHHHHRRSHPPTTTHWERPATCIPTHPTHHSSSSPTNQPNTRNSWKPTTRYSLLSHRSTRLHCPPTPNATAVTKTVSSLRRPCLVRRLPTGKSPSRIIAKNRNRIIGKNRSRIIGKNRSRITGKNRSRITGRNRR